MARQSLHRGRPRRRVGEMTQAEADAQAILEARVLQPDLVALIEAIVRAEIAAWAVARRDAALQEVRYIEKKILPKQG